MLACADILGGSPRSGITGFLSCIELCIRHICKTVNRSGQLLVILYIVVSLSAVICTNGLCLLRDILAIYNQRRRLKRYIGCIVVGMLHSVHNELHHAHVRVFRLLWLRQSILNGFLDCIGGEGCTGNLIDASNFVSRSSDKSRENSVDCILPERFVHRITRIGSIVLYLDDLAGLGIIGYFYLRLVSERLYGCRSLNDRSLRLRNFAFGQNKTCSQVCIFATLVLCGQLVSSCDCVSAPHKLAVFNRKSICDVSVRIGDRVLCLIVLRNCVKSGDRRLSSVNGRTCNAKLRMSKLERYIELIVKCDLQNSIACVVGQSGDCLTHHRLVMLRCKRISMCRRHNTCGPCKVCSQPNVLKMTQTVVLPLIGVKNDTVNGRVIVDCGRKSGKAQLIVTVVALGRKGCTHTT